MNVGSGFFGFLTLGGRPRAARRLARTRFLYCCQSQARKIRVQIVTTAALETMAEMMGVLARWLFYFSFFFGYADVFWEGRERNQQKCVSVVV